MNSSGLDAEFDRRMKTALLDVLIQAGLIAAMVVLCYQVFAPFLHLTVWAIISAEGCSVNGRPRYVSPATKSGVGCHVCAVASPTSVLQLSSVKGRLAFSGRSRNHLRFLSV